MTRKKKDKDSLIVSRGVNQPPSVNPSISNRLKKKKSISVDEYVKGILNRDIIMLSRAITLIESSLPEHADAASEIIDRCLPHSGNSSRIGITGVPGVGKSTFIESFGNLITGKNYRLAVLAVDPSSERSKGSILGDKTRMESLSSNPNVYIRPSPSAGSLGGVARKTREAIILCEAAGYEIIFIETVGVGQSETAVHSMVDFFLLLMLAGAGDELQGIKRGIMEMADMIAITKADGTNKERAEQAKSEFANALHLFPEPPSGWTPRVVTCSALKNTGLEEIWKSINDYFMHSKNNNFFQEKRKYQARYWMYEFINESLKNSFYNDALVKEKLAVMETRVMNESINSFQAAKSLLEEYFKKNKNP
ncbi:MAG: methylmalonyl Co-A mutase-associated GTPase MeaB [Bacteroidales bacterium]